MKTAEEFLSHAEERLMLLKIFGYTPKEDQIKDLCKIMEHFRKEGLKKAWDKGYESGSDYIRNRHWKSPETFITFKEWYNNKIKEV